MVSIRAQGNPPENLNPWPKPSSQMLISRDLATPGHNWRRSFLLWGILYGLHLKLCRGMNLAGAIRILWKAEEEDCRSMASGFHISLQCIMEFPHEHEMATILVNLKMSTESKPSGFWSIANLDAVSNPFHTNVAKHSCLHLGSPSSRHSSDDEFPHTYRFKKSSNVVSYRENEMESFQLVFDVGPLCM
jgi:hypothetical protein